METFEIKTHHLKLLQRAYVSWDNCEFGAPAINCKRPYGNSNVIEDIAEILKINKRKGYDVFSSDQEEKMSKIHKETQIALQICLILGRFEVGKYVKTDSYCCRSWKKV